MRLILEGPDNAGKTTLARRIAAGAPSDMIYFHPGGKPTDFDHETRCITEQLKQLTQYPNIVIDRITPISQMVYNPDELLDPVRLRTIQQYLDAGAIFIYCRPSIDRLLRTQDLTWREDETDEHKEKIIRNQHTFVLRYDQIMRKIPCVFYDFEHRELAKIIEAKAVNAMRGSIEDERWFSDLINFRG
jgi:hypothetical protein